MAAKAKAKEESKSVQAAKEFLESLTAEEKVLYEGVSGNEKALENLGNHVLLMKGFTQKTQQLSEAEKEVQAQLEANKKKRAELETWAKEKSATYDKVLKENEHLKTFKTAAEAKLARLAEIYNVPEDEVKIQMQATGQTAEEAAKAVARGDGGGSPNSGSGFDPNKFRSEVDREVSSAIGLAADFHDLQHEHNSLFTDKPLPMRELVSKAMQDEDVVAGKLDLRGFWEREYKVAQRREELATQKQEEREREIREEERTRVRDEMLAEGSYPQESSSRPGSPLLAMAKNGAFKIDPKQPIEDQDAFRGIEGAVKLFNSQELRDKAEAAAQKGEEL